VDAFTSEKFKGNPAGVVIAADGLSDREMQMIARELNNSETVFLLSPDGPDHEVRLRYFTPTVEVPICGHATIAAHYVRSLKNNFKTGRVMQKLSIGILPVDIESSSDDYTIWMTQGTIEFSSPLKDKDRQDLLAALTLNEQDLHPRCPIQIVSTGHSKVMVGIRSRQKLNRITPDENSLITLSKATGCNGYFVFTFADSPSDVLTHGRMFAPAIGVSEDPVTGNANGPLGAYLVKHGLVSHNNSLFSFTGAQGEAIGRDGRVMVKVAIENDQPTQVQVGGSAVIVFETKIQL